MFGEFKEACKRGDWNAAREMSQGHDSWRTWATSKYGMEDWLCEDEVASMLGFDRFETFCSAMQDGNLYLAYRLSGGCYEVRRWGVLTFGLPLGASDPECWLTSEELKVYNSQQGSSSLTEGTTAPWIPWFYPES